MSLDSAVSALLVIVCRRHNGQVWQDMCHRYNLYWYKAANNNFSSPLVSGVVGVLAIVLGVCLKWAILPPVVDSMVRCDNSIYFNSGKNTLSTMSSQ